MLVLDGEEATNTEYQNFYAEYKRGPGYRVKDSEAWHEVEAGLARSDGSALFWAGDKKVRGLGQHSGSGS